jgi:branched-chain amino acid transport system substrate-binding protein
MRKSMALVTQAAVAALIGLTALPVQAQSPEPIKVGAVFAISGPASIYGRDSDQALRLLIGDKGAAITGHPVALTIYDDEGNSAKSAQLFRRLVENEDVHVVIGPSITGTALAVKPLANQLKVPNLTHGGSHTVTTPVTPYVFGVNPVDRTVVEHLLAALRDKQIKKAALLYPLDGFGQSGGGQIEELAPRYGIEIKQETFGPQDTDMTPQLLRVKETNVEAVIVWGSNPGPTIVLKNAMGLGLKLPFFLGYGNGTRSFIAQTGPAAEGVFVTAMPIIAPEVLPEGPQKRLLADFETRYRQRYGLPPDVAAGHVIDSVLILEEALKSLKSPITRDKLRNAIEGVGFCGANGCRQMTAQDHRGYENKFATVLMQIRDGKWQAPN